MGDIDRVEVVRRFTAHEHNDEQAAASRLARGVFMRAGDELSELLPEGREKSAAFTALEESSFFAQAAIARQGK